MAPSGSGVLAGLASSALPALMAGLAVALRLAPPAGTARLRRVLPRRARRPAGRPALSVGPAAPALSVGPAAACLLAGAALALVLGGVAGLVLGLVVALAGPSGLSRLEPRAVRHERERVAADLPLALDLLAACLAGGASLTAAVRQVGRATPGPCGDRLCRVAASLEAGSPPAEAWQALLGRDDGGPAPAAVRALVRSAEGGTPAAAAVSRSAAEAREAARARGQAAAERAGVLAVAPLGLCFLPAFVLLGVVPVVVGLLGPLLAGL